MLRNHELEDTLRIYGGERTREEAARKMLNTAKRILSEKEYYVVDRMMGSTRNGFRREIAREIGTSPTMVSHIYRNAFRKLKFEEEKSGAAFR